MTPKNKLKISLEKVKAALVKAGSIHRAGVLLKVSHHVIRRVLAENGQAMQTATPKVKASRKTLDDFQKAFDKSFIVPERIKAGVSKYLRGGFWEHDQNFRELCKVPPHLWRRYADAFEDYQLRVDGKVVWAEPDTIEKMREMTL